MALPNGDLITTPFDPQMAYPSDRRMQVDTLNSRDSISMYIRWEGMTVYVLEDSKIYILQGGRSNEYWKELGTGSGTGGTTFVGQFPTADLLPTSGRSAGDYAFVGTGDDFVQYNWDNIANEWVMAEGQTDMASEFFHIGYKTPLRRPVIFPLLPKDILVDESGDFVFAPETSVARFIFVGEVEAIRGIETAADDREIKLVNRTGSDIPLRDKASGIPSGSGMDFGGSDYTLVNGSEITLKGNGTYWELAPNNNIAFSDHLDSVNAQVSVGSDGLEVISNVLNKKTGSFDSYKEYTGTKLADNLRYINLNGVKFKRANLVVTIEEFGAIGDGIADDTAAFHAARDWAFSIMGHPANNSVIEIRFSGNYLITESPNWAIERLRLVSIGISEIICTGSGPVMNLDGHSVPGVTRGIRGMYVADFLLTGNSTTTRIMNIVRISRSMFSNIRVRECSPTTGCGFYIARTVCNTFNTLICSINDTPGWTNTPKWGILMTNSLDDTGLATANTANNFYMTTIEFCSIGIEMTSGACDLNAFYGGTSEGNLDAGIIIGTGNRDNSFLDMALELNANFDIHDKGRGNRYQGGYFTKDIILEGTQLSLNRIRCQHIEVIGNDNKIDDVQVNSWVDPELTGGITDNGLRTQITKVFDFTAGRPYRPLGLGINRYMDAPGSIFIIPEREEEFYEFDFTTDKTATIYARNETNTGTLLHFRTVNTGKVTVTGRPGVLINGVDEGSVEVVNYGDELTLVLVAINSWKTLRKKDGTGGYTPKTNASNPAINITDKYYRVFEVTTTGGAATQTVNAGNYREGDTIEFINNGDKTLTVNAGTGVTLPTTILPGYRDTVKFVRAEVANKWRIARIHINGRESAVEYRSVAFPGNFSPGLKNEIWKSRSSASSVTHTITADQSLQSIVGTTIDVFNEATNADNILTLAAGAEVTISEPVSLAVGQHAKLIRTAANTWDVVSITETQSTFQALTDTPANYTGHKNKSVKVSNDETGLVFLADGVDVRNITDGGSIAPTLTDGFIGSRLNFTSSTAVTLQGFTSAGGQSSVTLVNPHATNNLTLVHNGAGTVKYIDAGATDLVIAPKTAVKLEIVGNEIYRVL